MVQPSFFAQEEESMFKQAKQQQARTPHVSGQSVSTTCK
jgi:hypothetical protein